MTSIAFPSGFTGDWSNGSIEAGATRSITVTFSPTAVATYGGSVTVSSDASGTNTIAISGAGTIGATRIVRLSGNLAFGEITIAPTYVKTEHLYITNTGNTTLTVTAITIPGKLGQMVRLGWSSGAIPAGSTQDVTATFTPTDTEPYTEDLVITSDATSGPNTFRVSGKGMIASWNMAGNNYVWGGPDYSQYLGFYNCIFCHDEWAYHEVDSINNDSSPYGSATSPTSIRNPNSEWGNQTSPYSVCNPNATHPPRVWNKDHTIYMGELTLNLSRPDYNDMKNWLAGFICAK